MKSWQHSVNCPFFVDIALQEECFVIFFPFFVTRLTEREKAFLAGSCWISGRLAGCLCLFGLMPSSFLAARLFLTSELCKARLLGEFW